MPSFYILTFLLISVILQRPKSATADGGSLRSLPPTKEKATVLLTFLTFLLTAIMGCTQNYYTTVYQLSDQASGEPDDIEVVDGAEGSKGLVATTTCAALAVDVFGLDGNAFYFDIEDEQLEKMNEQFYSGSWDYYVYDLDAVEKTYAYLYVVSKLTGEVADCGKVQVKFVGQSTGCAMSDEGCIPNWSVDVGEFVEGQTLGGVRWFRLNNSQIGSMYRESLVLEFLAELGVSTTRTSYAWVSNNTWNEDGESQENDALWVPYTVVEAYDEQFSLDHAEAFGGGIEEIREGWGDITGDMSTGLTECDLGDCSSERWNELIQTNDDAIYGEPYEETIAPYLDLENLKLQICAHWVFWIGDDPHHNFNNVKLALGFDGKYRYLEWSDDISLGQEWYTDVTLTTISSTGVHCEYDSTCWTDVRERVCPAVIDAYQAMDPLGRLEDLNTRLEAEGMLREPDSAQFQSVYSHIEERSAEGVLETELATYDPDYCPCADGNSDTGSLGDTAELNIVPLGGGWADTGWYPDDTGTYCWCDDSSGDTGSYSDTGYHDTGSWHDTGSLGDTASSSDTSTSDTGAP